MPSSERGHAVCRALGWSVQIDAPYKGTVVPRRFFRREPRVQSVLIEVNRRLYVADDGGEIRRGPVFAAVRDGVQRLIQTAVDAARDRSDSGKA